MDAYTTTSISRGYSTIKYPADMLGSRTDFYLEKNLKLTEKSSVGGQLKNVNIHLQNPSLL